MFGFVPVRLGLTRERIGCSVGKTNVHDPRPHSDSMQAKGTDQDCHAVVVIVWSEEPQKSARPFLVTDKGADLTVDGALIPAVASGGCHIVLFSRATNAWRQHAVGSGEGKRTSLQVRLTYASDAHRKNPPPFASILATARKTFGDRLSVV